MDRATTAVLARLRRGPASTVELQAELYATHVPKQIFDLRAAGYLITTWRLPDGVALYRLTHEPPHDYEHTHPQPPIPRPVFGDAAAIREMRR
jgi:hypothetical protein